MEKLNAVVTLLNALLEKDKVGVSAYFFHSTLVSIDIADTPVEIAFSGHEGFALMNALGLINGVLEVALNSGFRIVPVLENERTIKSFTVEEVVCEEFDLPTDPEE